MKPDSLFDQPRARNTDPVESHQAAASVTKLTEKQDAILALLKSRAGALSDPEIKAIYAQEEIFMGWPEQSESGLRTRRAELVRKGLVQRAGTTVLSSGRRAATWEPVE